MKKTAAALLFLAVSLSTATASEVIEEIMKKYHKPEDAICKKVGKGEATAADLDTLLKAYTDMCAETPAKGTKAVWVEKCQALIAAIKKVQADPKATSDFKKAVNCKACHDVFKGE